MHMLYDIAIMALLLLLQVLIATSTAPLGVAATANSVTTVINVVAAHTALVAVNH
jgi:hypothetical protein